MRIHGNDPEVTCQTELEASSARVPVDRCDAGAPKLGYPFKRSGDLHPNREVLRGEGSVAPRCDDPVDTSITSRPAQNPLP